MRISDWSSDVCSSDLMWITVGDVWRIRYRQIEARIAERAPPMTLPEIHDPLRARRVAPCNRQCRFRHVAERHIGLRPFDGDRSEEHTSELQSLMRISYAVFCLKKKNITITIANVYRVTHYTKKYCISNS